MAIHVAVRMAMQRVEVITDGGRRRRYDEGEKLRKPPPGAACRLK